MPPADDTYPLVMISAKTGLHVLNSSYSNLSGHLHAEGAPEVQIHGSDAETRSHEPVLRPLARIPIATTKMVPVLPRSSQFRLRVEVVMEHVSPTAGPLEALGQGAGPACHRAREGHAGPKVEGAVGVERERYRVGLGTPSKLRCR